MKKILIMLLLLVSPLIGQEKSEIQRRGYYKRPVFGLNLDLGYSYNIFSGSGVSIGIAPEFYLGKKVYFYLQFMLGYQYYNHTPTEGFLVIPAFSSFYFGSYIRNRGVYFRSR